MKKIVLLGSTGSIGESAVRVAEALPKDLSILGLAVGRNYEYALQQAQRFQVQHIAVADPEMARRCEREAPAGVRVYHGPEGVDELAALPEADVVLCAVVGMAGLRPVLSAIRQGTDVALATKEVLVSAGRLVTEECVKHGARLLPVDSEHGAIFQCLDRTFSDRTSADSAPPVLERSSVRRLILTASGGPFASRPDIDLDQVTAEQALDHPNWDMGRKVTIDSATLMNKGLEIMEAHWLFDVPMEQIAIVIHPESIVHSFVEFVDGNILAQLSLPDMRFAIQYALMYPERVDGGLPPLDLTRIGELHFHEPDEKRFPSLRLTREAGRRGGTLPVVLNAANEVAVQMFLDDKIRFSGIWQTVERVMQAHDVMENPDLEKIMEADAWAREAAAAGKKKG